MSDRDLYRAAEQARTRYLGTLLRKLWQAVAGWRERAALRAELAGLSDMELADIGLVRSDIEAVVQGRYRDERPALVTTPARPKLAAVVEDKRAA